jgi:8-oxo-dGTP pyrophosphatase MutT (NUDIX family)/phosphohistidine phosphatase SixA
VSHRPLRPERRTPIAAAGAICWRPTGDDAQGSAGLELLMVRSARWGDWSWPKGKIEASETLPECAVREVTEETGVRPALGLPLPSVGYVQPDGQPKTVAYWAARPGPSGTRTASDGEIADVEWVPAKAALERLTRPTDHIPVLELLARAERGELDTRPLLILRHAKARSRAHWPGDEADRPLTPVGQAQAQALPPLLACWAPERVLTSPWARCMQTLRSYDRLAGLEPEVLPLLSEQGLRNDPSRIADTINKLLVDPRGVLVCTHRPVLAAVVAALREAAPDSVADRLPRADPWLAPAEILVAHISNDSQPSVKRRIQMVEQYRPQSLQNVSR